MGLWCVPWLLLTLAQILQGQIPTPLPDFTQLKTFQNDQFQGEWFVLGLAGNTFRRQDRALLNPFITTFELNNKGHFEVSSAMTRGKRCDTWSYVLIPTTQPGQFTVDHGEPRSDKEDTQVMDTDYTRFALMLSLRQVSRQTVIRVSLLGRSWSLPPRTLDKFFCLARAQGLTKKNIMFPDMTEWPSHLDIC